MNFQLEVENLDVRYDEYQVLKQISFALESARIGCILGPSGCGKTTVLRAIAGFEPAFGGRILINQVEVSSSHFCMATEKRNIGMIFQDFALFPHLSVADNIRFGLKSWPAREQQGTMSRLQRSPTRSSARAIGQC